MAVYIKKQQENNINSYLKKFGKKSIFLEVIFNIISNVWENICIISHNC